MIASQTMSAKKEEINFNQYFSVLWQHAQSLGLNKGEWMVKSGVGRQRFAEFSRSWVESKVGVKGDKPARNLTAPYFLRLLSPLQITPQEVESMSGQKFTEEQKDKFKFDAWLRSQEETLVILMKNPEKWELCKQLCALKDGNKE